MPPEIVCNTVFGWEFVLKTRNLAAVNWCQAPIIGGWVIVCDTIFRGTGPGAIVGRTSLQQKGRGGQFGGRRGSWVETVPDTVLGGGGLLKTRDLAALSWCLAPIKGGWDRVHETVFCGVAPGAICGGTSLLGERRGRRAEIVCDTVFGGEPLLKLRDLVAINWCLAPINWGEGNCV
jgi:hypothetical protein